MARPKNCGRCRKPKSQCKCGRPTVMTEKVIRKLEDAFSFGCSDREACLYADIAPISLYSYCKKNPEFAKRKELLKEKPVMYARKTVVEAIQSGDSDLSFKYLKSKKASEFAEKIIEEQEGPITVIEVIAPKAPAKKQISHEDQIPSDTEAV